LFLSPVSIITPQKTVPHAQPQLGVLDSLADSFVMPAFDLINSYCLTDCVFGPKLLTRRAELPMQVHSNSHGIPTLRISSSFAQAVTANIA
jgi:hypothetical protein